MRSTNRQTNIPDSFEFEYRAEPEPGLRRWHRSGNTWKEVYPSGHVTVLQITRTCKLSNGIAGSIAQKDDGFQIFIPDVSYENVQLLGAYPNENWALYAKDKENSWYEFVTITNLSPIPQNKTEKQSSMLVTRNEPHSSKTAKALPILTQFVLPMMQLGMEASKEKKARQAREEEAQRSQQQEILKREQAQQEKKSLIEKEKREKTQANINESIKNFNSLLDQIDLTHYHSYDHFKQNIEEVDEFSLSDGIKKGLFEQKKEQQQKEIPPVIPTQAFFSKNEPLIDDEKAIAIFQDRLVKLAINTDDDYSKFKKTPFYKNCLLDEYTKDRIFHVHKNNVNINITVSELRNNLSNHHQEGNENLSAQFKW